MSQILACRGDYVVEQQGLRWALEYCLVDTRRGQTVAMLRDLRAALLLMEYYVEESNP